VAVKVGDKVKFLNTTGGGVVTKIIDSRLVSVSIEGGFEIPVQASELVVMDPGDAGGRFFSESYPVADSPETDLPQEEDTERYTALPGHILKSRKSEDIYLSFIPHDQKWLITGNLDIQIINTTSYDLLYNLYSKDDDGSWTGVDYGSLAAGTKLLIATVDRDDLPRWTDGCLQFLFHKEKCERVPPPFHAEYSISGKKFYSEQSYRESVYTDDKSIVVKIATVTPAPEAPKDQQEPNIPVASEPANKDDFILKHRTGEREAEVDLHIHELVEDSSGWDKAEILEYQKKYFLRCMESALVNKFLKVIFIHGVGNGVLKNELTDLLKKKEGIEVLDAPMHKYGVGALEVRIPHNL
jgi:hypothetical protein